MEIIKLDRDFTICKIRDLNHVDLNREFVFLSKTDEEISLVCESCFTPTNASETEPGWKALKIAGVLDFGMTGVIARITDILARAGIGVFVVSTYNTDYIFMKARDFKKSAGLLGNNGYALI